ncbi:DNA-binding protein [Oceanicola sp. 22II-s10i]|uniref:Zn-ribbon domain-containing OB-fold protein n=1 Tax=Oceanicola sp. 22II-s10i TaxID=1317116 RepID=UPI000B5258C4|nr:Zn-ribbon domain-containing OB-fold protein [Oceanicola sp. 22II-s10i]OWU83733.1 DNA-binding protein [Oceanicola sp. 22II-s10i]
MTDRVLPTPTPETRHYWEGAKAGELRLQRCDKCSQAYFPPRPFCPECGSRDVSVFKASGKGTLHSYIINELGAPGLKPPFAVAIVQLEEGPRLLSNILECDQTPEALQLDMPLEVVFEKVTDDITLPQFRPAKEA